MARATEDTAGPPALNDFDGYRRARLPANLLQAQRDYFGAHTYERLDVPGGQVFHTDWIRERNGVGFVIACNLLSCSPLPGERGAGRRVSRGL